MLREMFIGRNPTHFQINPIVKAFIIAEMMLWSAWNFMTPIFALFAVSIPGGNVQIAASAYSVHLVVRVIGELISGRFLSNSGELRKFMFTILGILIISFAYFGFTITKSVPAIYLFYGIAGIGIGIASPAKNSLFSTHLDKNKEAYEWGIMDASVFMCMALAAVIGGFVVSQYGFRILFIIACFVNLLSIFPYILYIRHEEAWVIRLKRIFLRQKEAAFK